MTIQLPVVYLLPKNLEADELHELEAKIPTLTYDINEADVVVGKISQKVRALFELRSRKLTTEEVAPEDLTPSPERAWRAAAVVDTDSDTASEGHADGRADPSPRASSSDTPEVVRVVKLAWLTESLRKGRPEPLDDYLVYAGRKTAGRKRKRTPPAPTPATPRREDILLRAKLDAASLPEPRRYGGSSQGASSWRRNREHHRDHPVKPPPLLVQSTTEHDIDLNLPPVPDYLHTTYSCQRATPMHPPNEAFIRQLMKIRTTRTLLGDKIGVRAYSSSIATLSAYPYTLSSPHEVARLPGCGMKIALLYQEWRETGRVREVAEAESDPELTVLRLFYEIWGVAETTARQFYGKGWRDLDDVVEYGWSTLTRVQQIGVKYYDEFQLKIPRREVAGIADVVLEHANRIHGGFRLVVVGGYRRGKTENGDVDMVVSHPDESVTADFVERIVVALEESGYITHTLTLSMKNSERGQEPVAWKGNERKAAAGTGFDTLDKSLVVWQDPNWTATKEVKKNPNPHRRVDIIVSPWKTAGCAVLGWTSGTTFQRDLRRYCKKELGLKFDSSGIRSRVDGSWVDLESRDGKPAPDMLTAEKRVFEGLGLEWREPEERCTG